MDRRGGTAAPDEPYDAIRAGSIDGTDPEPHDHGIVRALQAHCTPCSRPPLPDEPNQPPPAWLGRADDASQDPQIKGSARRTLFVGRLDYVTDEETLRATFAHFGPIRRLHLVRDIGMQWLCVRPSRPPTRSKRRLTPTATQ
jgi:U11/U12 small nuclear ribonucleoprotein SNRNP35